MGKLLPAPKSHNTLKMPNIVNLKAVGALLNGKEHFYIPSYQRGFRWRRKQVEDLLGDLYSFTRRPRIATETSTSPYGDFYCLQALIVKPIPVGDPRRDKALPPELAGDPEHRLWELVDGQQRLTVILLLLRSFLKILKNDIKEDYEKDYYTIYYESRPTFIEGLDKEDADPDIDLLHARAVCRVAEEWVSREHNGKGIELSQLYLGGEGATRKALASEIVNLIVANTSADVVKFIWYQLDAAAETDTVREFIRINNGKIPLLDSELVKALFLQRRYDPQGKLLDVATQRAMEWENMENRLNASDFWCFISPDDNSTEDRMGYLLEMLYRAERKKLSPNERSIKIENGDVFRFFYNAFEGKKGDALKTALDEKWALIVDAFHAIEDWYESPLRFNYIGFLIQAGEDAADIYAAFRLGVDNMLPAGISFDQWLKGRIRRQFPEDMVSLVDTETSTHESDGEEMLRKKPRITVEYGRGTKTIRNIFRLLNIELLTSQFRLISQGKDKKDIRDSGVFRFPFDLYKANGWDIEHIDSQTENPLKSNEDQVRWITGAMLDTVTGLTEDDRSEMEKNVKMVESDREARPSWDFLAGKISPELMSELNKGGWKKAVALIQNEVGVEKHNEHFIGNLTLLDTATNRTYKNALFCSKRKSIIEAVSAGSYILPATQYVFMKFFDPDTISATSRIRWSGADKEKHHDFIYNQLKEFLPDAR